MYGIEATELRPRVIGREGPGDGSMLLVALGLQCSKVSFQRGSVSCPSPKAFPTDDGNLDLSEPKLLHLL
jgi:hypothetical protein